jgi:hypothetical protein
MGTLCIEQAVLVVLTLPHGANSCVHCRGLDETPLQRCSIGTRRIPQARPGAGVM